MAADITARGTAGTAPASGRPAGGHPALPGAVHPVERRAPVPPTALDLLAQARAGLVEAAALPSANERFATAHLAALRAAAAVLAVRARPDTDRRGRRRIRSAWEVLPEVAPELAEWSRLFASGAARRARAEAGLAGAATERDADDLLRAVAMFVRIVERIPALQPPLPRPQAEPA